MKRVCRADDGVKGSGCWTCKHFRVQRRGLSGACNHEDVDFDGVRHHCKFHDLAPSVSELHEKKWEEYESKNIIQRIATVSPPDEEELLRRLKNKDDVVIVWQRE